MFLSVLLQPTTQQIRSIVKKSLIYHVTVHENNQSYSHFIAERCAGVDFIIPSPDMPTANIDKTVRRNTKIKIENVV